jgi:hypothetical protein
MTLITKGMGAILKKALGTFKKGKKVKEISYPKDSTKFMRKTFRDRLKTPRGPGKGKQGPKPKSEEVVSFDTKKVYVKDK